MWAVLSGLLLLLPLSASASRVRVASVPRASGVSALAGMRSSLAGRILAPGLCGLAPQVDLLLQPKLLTGGLPVSQAWPQSIPSLLAPQAAAPAASAAAPVSLSAGLTQAVASFERAQSRDRSGASGSRVLRGMYEGRTAAATAVSAEAQPVVNDEGVGVFGRAAEYYQEVRRTAERLRGRVDLGESLDVMDDAYADVWSKLKAVETVAKNRNVDRHNTHLEASLVWVDGVMRDQGRSVAIHTHRVYFHASANPRSEIEEGIRRVDRYLSEAVGHFARHGKAEKVLGRLDEVVLVFDTRGYSEIKAHLESRRKEIAAQAGQRYRFMYLDELAPAPSSVAAMRAELNALAQKYQGQGLDKIVEGVIYSRYVGLLLELKTIEHYQDLGFRILQSGRELFDSAGKYVTELDVVVQAPDGKVAVVEAKSARVPMAPEAVLKDKVIAKLDTYSKNRPALEASIGHQLDAVIFSVDVGRQPALAAFLRSQETALSQRYGFPVQFLFLDNGSDAAPAFRSKAR
ncbi:MAG: hypothetical protein WC881_03130 [Elusimicrobiota bacterium]